MNEENETAKKLKRKLKQHTKQKIIHLQSYAKFLIKSNHYRLFTIIRIKPLNNN